VQGGQEGRTVLREILRLLPLSLEVVQLLPEVRAVIPVAGPEDLVLEELALAEEPGVAGPETLIPAVMQIIILAGLVPEVLPVVGPEEKGLTQAPRVLLEVLRQKQAQEEAVAVVCAPIGIVGFFLAALQPTGKAVVVVVVAVVEREIPEVPEVPEVRQTLQRIIVYL